LAELSAALLIAQDGAAHALLIAVAAVAALGEWAAAAAGYVRRRSGEGRVDDRGTRQILVIAVIAGLGVSYAVASRAPSLRFAANNWLTLSLGAVIALGGVLLRAWAVRTLGGYFQLSVTIEPGQQLVRSGPYRWIRHPAYAGFLAAFTGIGLMFGSWVSAAVAFAAVFLGCLPRIRVEEEVLERAFGADYVEYERETARLVPHVW
jgi:protein-S-isoprenylcysteine O-methyltransferase